MEQFVRHPVEERLHREDHDDEVIQPAEDRRVVRDEIAAEDHVARCRREDKRRREKDEAEIYATRIGSTTLTMGVKVGDGGKLYGSITAKDIADALARRGIEVDRHKVDLEEPLKSLGTYKVAIKVYAGMTPEVTIVVEPKG